MPTLAVQDDAFARREDVEHYLRTDKYGTTSPAWPGNAWERELHAHKDMMQALVTEVK